MKELPISKKIAIFGGGRWSKILLDILIKNTKSNIEFSVHTKHLVDEMLQWSKTNNYIDRITITSTDPNLDQKYFGAVVVNSAKYHKEKALLAIKSRIPVLVEKPMTPTFTETKELIDLAQDYDTQLLSSWVFRYAKYIDNFIASIKEFEPIQEVDIIWTDPINENRNGEIKTFDRAIPLFEDVMPHLLSILSKVLNCNDFKFQNSLIRRGGASIEILLLSGNVKCNLKIQRNASQRVRKILINSRKDVFLDFSNEPGVIKIKDKEYIGDSEWDKSPRPLTMMIIDFLEAIDNKKSSNKNLDNNLALTVSRLNDEVKIYYHDSLYKWFMSIISNKEKAIKKNDLIYFISEIIYKESSLPHEDKDKMISKFMKFMLDNLKNESFYESFSKEFSPNHLIEDVNYKIFSICAK